MVGAGGLALVTLSLSPQAGAVCVSLALLFVVARRGERHEASTTFSSSSGDAQELWAPGPTVLQPLGARLRAAQASSEPMAPVVPVSSKVVTGPFLPVTKRPPFVCTPQQLLAQADYFGSKNGPHDRWFTKCACGKACVRGGGAQQPGSPCHEIAPLKPPVVNVCVCTGPKFEYLERIRQATAEAADAAGVSIVTFDVGCNKGYDTAIVFEMLAPGAWNAWHGVGTVGWGGDRGVGWGPWGGVGHAHLVGDVRRMLAPGCAPRCLPLPPGLQSPCTPCRLGIGGGPPPARAVKLLESRAWLPELV